MSATHTPAQHAQPNAQNEQTIDEELSKVAMNAMIQAYVGQRDEALARCADLFAKLNVAETVIKRLSSDNENLRADLEALTKKDSNAPATT